MNKKIINNELIFAVAALHTQSSGCVVGNQPRKGTNHHGCLPPNHVAGNQAAVGVWRDGLRSPQLLAHHELLLASAHYTRYSQALMFTYKCNNYHELLLASAHTHVTHKH